MICIDKITQKQYNVLHYTTNEGDSMSQTNLSVRIDSEDKKRFEEFCNQTGLNVSVAINMFVKSVLRESKLPFEVKADPFYSEANMNRLRKSIAQMEATGGTIHEVPLDD